MKILSLYEPYATLAVLGYKQNETRCWETKHRGTLGIHATATLPKWCSELMKKDPFNRYLLPPLGNGEIIGTVEVVDCVPVAEWFKMKFRERLNAPLSDRVRLQKEQDIEVAFGDYSKGRFIWLLTNPVKFDRPIKAKGFQRLWNYNL